MVGLCIDGHKLFVVVESEWKSGPKGCNSMDCTMRDGSLMLTASVLTLHSRATVTCYGTRRSSKMTGSTAAAENKENTSPGDNKVSR